MKNQKRLLIVDDEPVFLLAARKALQEPDFEVDVAETVDEVRTLLRRHHYHAVIADLRLDGADGQEGLEIMRLIKDLRPNTKRILMTAYGDDKVKKTAADLGVHLYFEKPVSVSVLHKSLTRLLKHN